MIGIILGIVFIVIAIILGIVECFTETGISGIVAFLCVIISIGCFLIIPPFTGVINYVETNDYDKARITAVDTIQTPFRVYWKVDVEYLTNTPTQDEIITNKNIEKDTYYTDDKELVEKLRANMYKEITIVSGFKGGYETWKTFREGLIKDFEIINEK